MGTGGALWVLQGFCGYQRATVGAARVLWVPEGHCGCCKGSVGTRGPLWVLEGPVGTRGSLWVPGARRQELIIDGWMWASGRGFRPP